jgi:hypothetical protein
MDKEPIFSALDGKNNCPPGYAVRWQAIYPGTTYQDCVDYLTEVGNPATAAADCNECVFDGG